MVKLKSNDDPIKLLEILGKDKLEGKPIGELKNRARLDAEEEVINKIYKLNRK